MNVKDHYDNHLAQHYSWIYGGADLNIEKNKSFFNEHKLTPNSSGVALDLGAGSGFQSIPLQQLGYRVIAVDFSKEILRKLESRDLSHSIEIVQTDMLDFSSYAGKNPELIVCMGDTLTHLPDLNSVKKLITNSYSELDSGGRLALSFRDLTYELKDNERFIPIQSEPEKIFTCFIENQGDHIDVYDIVQEKMNGEWKQKISFYPKIKISEDQIKKILLSSGFVVDFFEKKRGLITAIARKN